MLQPLIIRPLHIGVGLYSIRDAARLLRVRPSTLRSWVSPKGRLVPRRLPVEEKAVTFAELMELHFIAMFHSEGVSLQTIRKASVAAAVKFSTGYPFSAKQFGADGRTIFATLLGEEKNSVVTEDLKHAQCVFEKTVKAFFHKLEFRGAPQVSHFWPMGKKGRVVLDPARKFGRPIDAETGVPTSAIYNACRAGGGQDAKTVAQWLAIPPRAVEAAVAFESSLPE